MSSDHIGTLIEAVERMRSKVEALAKENVDESLKIQELMFKIENLNKYSITTVDFNELRHKVESLTAKYDGGYGWKSAIAREIVATAKWIIVGAISLAASGYIKSLISS